MPFLISVTDAQSGQSGSVLGWEDGVKGIGRRGERTDSAHRVRHDGVVLTP